MRTIKASAISMLVGGLLAGSALGVAAQDEQAALEAAATMAPAVFKGEATCGLHHVAGEWITSDSRITGPCSITPTSWGGPIPGALGDNTVSGLEGSWTGTWLLIPVDSKTGHTFMTLAGTGAYEGWAVLAWAGTPEGWQDGDPFALEGVIYEGSAPQLTWPEPPIE